MPEKTTKLLTKRRKFILVELPSVKSKIELIADSIEQLNNRTIKLDLTRQLKGKSVEGTFVVKIENNEAVAHPEKIKLMSYFIRRMIRKRISYVEDSFEAPSQENMILVKPFLITRKKVSRAVRKTLRNKTKNWLEDYISERKNKEIFEDILTNRLQKSLSLMLKKTYPLSLCEIRIIEIKRKLNQEEIPKIKEKPKEIKKQADEEEFIDQLKEIEDEKIKKAEKEIKEAQEKAARQSSDLEKLEPATQSSDLEKLEPATQSSDLGQFSVSRQSSDLEKSEPATQSSDLKKSEPITQTEPTIKSEPAVQSSSEDAPVTTPKKRGRKKKTEK